jgi:hypothetical protein
VLWGEVEEVTMDKARQALKSRTVQFGIAIACLSVMQGFVHFIPANPVVQMTIGCGIASGIIVLRYMTTQPMSEK